MPLTDTPEGALIPRGGFPGACGRAGSIILPRSRSFVYGGSQGFLELRLLANGILERRTSLSHTCAFSLGNHARQTSLTHLPRAGGRWQSVTEFSVVKRMGSVAKKRGKGGMSYQTAGLGSSVARSRNIPFLAQSTRAPLYSDAVAFERIFDLQFGPRDQLAP